MVTSEFKDLSLSELCSIREELHKNLTLIEMEIEIKARRGE